MPNGGALNDYSCGGGVAQEAWVVHPAVMAALHVPADALFVSADNGVGMQYDLTEKNLMPFYRDVAENHPEMRVMVYNGDTDPCINSFVSQNWTVALGFEVVLLFTSQCSHVFTWLLTFLKEIKLLC